MSARIFIHPRCIPFAPPQAAMQAALEGAGYRTETHLIGPANGRGHHELVKLVSGDVRGFATYERCDGSRFSFNAGKESA